MHVLLTTTVVLLLPVAVQAERMTKSLCFEEEAGRGKRSE